MNCLPNTPGADRAVDELSEHLGSRSMAIAVISANNGHAIDKTYTGQDSILYKEILRAANNDHTVASVVKSSFYSPEFIKKHGDWINNPAGYNTDKNGEPILYSIPLTEEKNNYVIEANEQVTIDIPKIFKYQIDKGTKSKEEMAAFAKQHKVEQNFYDNKQQVQKVTHETVVDKLISLAIKEGKTNEDVFANFNTADMNILPVLMDDIQDAEFQKMRKEYVDSGIENPYAIIKQELDKRYLEFKEKQQPQLPSATETVTTPPEFNENDNIFVHAEAADELPAIYSKMDKAIADGVKTFIVMPKELRNEFDTQIINRLQAAPNFWVYRTKGQIHYMARPVQKVAESKEVAEKEEPKPEKKFEYFNKEDKVLKIGSVVEYTPKGKSKQEFIIHNFTAAGVKLIDANGVIQTGTPAADNVTTIGSYPVVTDPKTGNQFIIADNDDLYSVKTGKLSYANKENTKADRDRILAQKQPLIEAGQNKVLKDRNLKELTQQGNIVNVRGIAIDLFNDLGMNFRLSDNQLNALNEFADWLDDTEDNRPFSIEGIAGSGKTTMLRVFREYARRANMGTKFTALTNQATINLELAVKAPADTVHSMLGLAPEVELDDKEDLEFNLSGKGGISQDTVLFIDEISMATHEGDNNLTDMLFELNNVKKNQRVVFIGNMSQLKPINQTTNTRVFDPVQTKNVKLEQSMRQQADNPAMIVYKHYSENQRQKKFLTDGTVSESTYNPISGQGLKWIDDLEQFFRGIIEDFKKARELNDWTYTRVLAYSNKTVADYNKNIRIALFGQNLTNMVDKEVIIANRNSKLLRKGIPYIADSVSEIVMEDIGDGIILPIRTVKLKPAFDTSYKSVSGETLELVKNAEIKFIDIDAGDKNYFEEKSITKRKKNGDTYTVKVQVAKGNLLAFAEKIQEMKRDIRSARNPKDRAAKVTKWKEFISKYNLFHDVNNESVTVLSSGVNYYYAGTVHKAQGSTYETVHVDQAEIKELSEYNATKRSPSEYERLNHYEQYNQLIYTGFTRARSVANAFTADTIQKGPNHANKNLSGLTFQNRQVVKGTMTEVALRFAAANEQRSEDIMQYVDDKADVPIWSALSAAVHDATMLTLEDPIVKAANNRLAIRIATEESDPRILETVKTDDRELYNAFVYDVYSNTMIRHMGTQTDDEQLHDLGNFFIRTSNVKTKMDAQIDTLERQITELKQQGAPLAQSQSLAQVLLKKKALRQELLDKETVNELIDIGMDDISRVHDIVKKPNISESELIEGLKLCDTWIQAGIFEDINEHIFLDSTEAQEPAIQEKFAELGSLAEVLKNQLKTKGKNIVTNWSNAQTGKQFTFASIMKLRSKMNWFWKNTLGAINIDNPFIQSIVKMINKANSMAEIKAITESRKLADLYKKLKDRHYDLSLFRQKDKNGIITGNMVEEYSYEYGKGYERCMNAKGKKGYTIGFLHNNSVVINPERAATDATAYIAELTPILGNIKAQKVVAEAGDAYKEYLEVKKNFMQNEFNTTVSAYLSQAQKDILKDWAIENDPMMRYGILTDSTFKNDKVGDIAVGSLGQRFIVIAAKRYDSNGDETGHYDKTYDAIHSDPDAAEFYEMAEKITIRAQENFNIRGMSSHALSYVNSTMIQEFNQSGIKEFTQKALVKYFRAGMDFGDNIDPLTGKPIRKLQANVDTLEKRILDEYRRIKDTEFSGQTITTQMDMEIKKRAVDNVTADDRNDLFMALNTLNMASLAFAHKSQIQPQLEMAMYYLDEIKGMSPRERLQQALTDEQAKSVPDQFKIKKLQTALKNTTNNQSLRHITEEDIAQVKEMLDYFLDKDYYDVPDEDRSHKFGKKMYTPEEKKAKANLEAFITKETNKANPNFSAIQKAQEDLSKLGSQMSVNRIVKMLMDGMRLSVLGWSLRSFIGNLMQGQIANVIHAAAGKYYTYEELGKAGKLLINPKQKEKFDAIVRNYAILGDIMYDFAHNSPFQEKKSWLGSLTRYIKPFEGNKIAETANQGMLMTAMMLHMQMENTATGEKVSMWEAVDGSGELKPGFSYNGMTGDEAVAEMAMLIRNHVGEIHGDYTSNVLGQKTMGGKAAMTFKKWFFQPFFARFGTDGRYIAAYDALKAFKFNYRELMRAYRRGEVNMETVGKIKVVAAELMIALVSYLLTHLVRASLCGDNSSKSKCGGKGANFAMNMLNKIDQETRTFVSVSGYYNLISNPIAVARYLDVMSKTITAMEGYVKGNGIDNEEGENKVLKLWGKQIPAVSQAYMWGQMMGDVKAN